MFLKPTIADYFENIATDRISGGFSAVIKAFLCALSLLYGLLIVLFSMVRGFKPAVLQAKVISVGNITWGGTGKTPLVELLAGFLRSEGRNIAILTRGYKRSVSRDRALADASASRMGDEPYMLSSKLKNVPVIVNGDRVKAGIEAQQLHKADTLILDDGFQQWGLQKDLDIVAIDAGNPFGNKWLIPRGILREPLSALKRADVFVLTNIDAAVDLAGLKADLAVRNPSALIVAARHKPSGFYRLGNASAPCSEETVRSGPAALVSGIGNPGSFRRAAESLRIRVAHAFVFPDHHLYSDSDVASINDCAQALGIKTIITTEKDAVKLAFFAPLIEPEVFVLRVELEIVDNKELFYDRLRCVCSS